MLQLTKEQLDFLNHHNIPLSSVFDASGLTPKEYKPLMKDLDKSIAIGVTPCKKGDHILRLRTGHCIICNPEGFAHFNRHHENSYVYVAASKNCMKLKIGFTKDILNREESLNRTNYAGMNDWKIIYYIQCKNAGKIESKIQSGLSQFYSPGEYQKEGRIVACYELFQCDYKSIKEVIEKIKIEFVSENFKLETELKGAENDYNFSIHSNKTHKRIGNEITLENSQHKNNKSNSETDNLKSNNISEKLSDPPPLLENNEFEASNILFENTPKLVTLKTENNILTQQSHSNTQNLDSQNESTHKPSLSENKKERKYMIRNFTVLILIVLILYLLYR